LKVRADALEIRKKPIGILRSILWHGCNSQPISNGVRILPYIVQLRPPLRADRHDERRVTSQAHSEHRRFLRRIEQAHSSLRAGRGISLEDVETE
jgi:hypothetical protein